MTGDAAWLEFDRRYREQGGHAAERVAAVRELFAAYEQAKVMAGELSTTFAAERKRSAELSRALQSLEQAHNSLAESEVRFRSLVSNSHDATLVVTFEGIVSYASPSSLGVLGLADTALVDRPLTDLVDQLDRPTLMRALLRLANTRESVERVELRIASTAGMRHIEAVCRRGDAGPFEGRVIINARDATDRKRLAAALDHQAQHDALTGLPNRKSLIAQLQRTLRAGRARPNGVALLVVDVDHFKLVNDVRGEAFGDSVLVGIARHLSELAPHGSLVARLGGDEFAVLLTQTDAVSATGLAGAFLQELNESATQRAPGSERLSVSVGGNCHPVETAESMLQCAEVALYEAKRSGGGLAVMFDPSKDLKWTERSSLAADLSRATEHGELSLVYQPIVRLHDRRTVALEALLRWTHSQRGSISPAEFIPLAEETGLITEIGEWVVRQACADMSERVRAGGTPVRVSVNVSALELENGQVQQNVEAALAESRIDPGLLQLEITESVLARDPSVMLERLSALRGIGVRLAIDDFGTGYSSLSYVARMPVDVLKLDQSFVSSLRSDRRVAAIVRATLMLASDLRLEVVAEGVETEAQAAGLRRLGCEHGQGFLYARPAPLEELRTLIAPSMEARSDRTRAS